MNAPAPATAGVLACLAKGPATVAQLVAATAADMVGVRRVLDALGRTGAVARVPQAKRTAPYFALTRAGQQLARGAATPARGEAAREPSFEQRVWTALRMKKIATTRELVESFVTALGRAEFRAACVRALKYLTKIEPTGVIQGSKGKGARRWRLADDIGPAALRVRWRTGTIYDPNHRRIIWPPGTKRPPGRKGAKGASS